MAHTYKDSFLMLNRLERKFHKFKRNSRKSFKNSRKGDYSPYIDYFKRGGFDSDKGRFYTRGYKMR